MGNVRHAKQTRQTRCLSIRKVYDVISLAHASLCPLRSAERQGLVRISCSTPLPTLVYEVVTLEQYEPTHSVYSARPSPRRQFSVFSLPAMSRILAQHCSSFTQQKASKYGLTGWVSNTSSGKVGMNIPAR